MAVADRVYRSFLASTRFFSRGWGPVDTYRRLLEMNPIFTDRQRCLDAMSEHIHPVSVKKVKSLSYGQVYEGRFDSPLKTMMPGILPAESQVACFEMLLPSAWRPQQSRPLFIHLAGTGDHYYWRRKYLTALPLLKDNGIGSVLLENPYYGVRKPKQQVRSQLHHVSDLFVMGLALMLECVVLLQWLEQEGLGPVGLTGISMGGHNASLAATLWPKPVAVVPCLSWSTASSVFTEGILSQAVCWDVLEEQLFYSKIGCDEDRWKIFRETVTLHEEKKLTKKDMPSLFNGGESFHHGHSEVVEDTLTRHRQKLRSKRKKQSLHEDAVSMLQVVLDTATHISTFSRPLAPELVVFLAAKEDLYIPRQNITDVRCSWPGCEVHYIEGGHVSSSLLQQSQFRTAMVNTMDKLILSHSTVTS